ncbi:MAG: hypothetical protein AB7E05_01925 [Sphingobium sp.]
MNLSIGMPARDFGRDRERMKNLVDLGDVGETYAHEISVGSR